MVTNHTPQMKYCRNIISAKRALGHGSSRMRMRRSAREPE